MARSGWVLLGLFIFLSAAAAGVWLGSAAQPGQQSSNTIDRGLISGRRALAGGSYSEAAQLARAISDDSPWAAEARLLEGEALWHLNRWQAAEQAWKRALELDATVPEAGWKLLNSYFVQQRWQESDTLALELYEREPDPRDRTLLLLELIRQDHERLGPEAAAVMLEPVLVCEPDNYHVLRVLGMSYVQLGRIRDGLALVERAVTQDPHETEGWYTLVWCLFETGELDRLGRVWPQLPPPAAADPRLLRYRGMWAETLGDTAAAAQAFHAALAADPTDRKAHYQLARLLRASGDQPSATAHEQHAQELNQARDELALCYTQAIQQNDDPSAELCRKISRLCHMLGRTRQATYWDFESQRRSSG